MTQKDQNMVIEMIEELTVWENRICGWRAELKKLLIKEAARRKQNPDRAKEFFIKRGVRKQLRQQLNNQ